MAATATATPTLTAVTMLLTKETKGAVKYDAIGEVIPTLYIRKEAFADGQYPTKIVVSIVAL